MGHIADGIFDLPVGERPPRPIGESRALVDLVAGEMGNQIGVAHLLAHAERHGGDLRVEHGRRCAADEIVENFQILPAGVDQLQQSLVIQHGEEGRQIHPRCQRVDRGRLLVAGKLQQAQLRIVGVLAHELGVDGDEGATGEAGA